MPTTAGPSRPRLTLLVFTESFPFDVALEDTFIGPELPFLREAFARLIVVPSRRDGSRANLPDGVETDESLADAIGDRRRLAMLARGASSRLLRSDLREDPSRVLDVRAMKRLVSMAARAEVTRAWVLRAMSRWDLDPATTVAYTFWCDHTTTGLGLVKSRWPSLKVVSRAHGADLYENRHEPAYLPARSTTLRHLDLLLPDSLRGAKHVAGRYPWFAPRVEVARMGVPDPGFLANRSTDGRWVVVSCSRIVPIKRVDLIVAAVAHAAALRPDVAFEWHHFGDGPSRPEIEAMARSLPANVTASLPGYSSLPDLMAFYRTHPVDVFVNASISEGTPVAVMEAISCGIPVVATAVGGNTELVSDDNGALVPPDPSPDELAAAVVALIDDAATTGRKRLASRAVWQSRYDAQANYVAFAARLVDLRRGA